MHNARVSYGTPSAVKPSESVIQSHILAKLDEISRQKPGVLRVRRCNNGVAKARNRFVRFGEPGAADIQGIFRGQFLAIEVKSDGGKLSKLQRAWGDDIIRHGGIYLVVHSWDEVKFALFEQVRAVSFCDVCGANRVTVRP